MSLSETVDRTGSKDNHVKLFSLFFSSATMATAPYNYSYIFKYIIIGKSKRRLENASVIPAAALLPDAF